jgi:large subunit ribosomal protein L21
MHAVIRSGGKQYRVAKGDVIRLPFLEGEPGNEVEIGDVLQVTGDGENQLSLGAPTVANAKVKAKIIRHGKDKKILVYTFKRRKGYEKRKGHRQDFTEVRIEDISL